MNPALGAKGTSPRKPILYVVDDEPLLLEVAEMAMEGDGYELRKFEDPTAALAHMESVQADKPSALVTDFAMRFMNGMELAAKSKALFPHLKIMLVSGTVDERIFKQSKIKVDRFLRKPFRPQELADTVRSMLAEA